MKKGLLSQYFTGFGYKVLAATEVDPSTSRGHEFQGIKPFQNIFGTEKQIFNCTFIHLSDRHETGILSQTGTLTWYDSREDQPHRSAEYRLYYPSEATIVQEYARAGDLVVIARKNEGDLFVIIADAGSTYEQQLFYLFDIHPESLTGKFAVEVTPERGLEYASRIILENIGIEIQDEAPDYLELLLKKFNGRFPTTTIFSAFARDTLKDISPQDDPDSALIRWIEHEEILFRTLERHIVSETLKSGFGNGDQGVDNFISFSLSVHNRRKSRAGHSLENHLQYLFDQLHIRYSKGQTTENKSRPDFIFPTIEQYRDPNFPVAKLTMLGAKTTCKDRWRQVLSEAQKIQNKHLLTLEPSITEDQTSEMQARELQLVVPASIQATYKQTQQKWLMDVSSLVKLLRERQG